LKLLDADARVLSQQHSQTVGHRGAYRI
jgi:hypothetical protein